MNQINAFCADCGVVGGVNLKVCKACMAVKYCNAVCQKKHWAMHKKQCKLRAAELRDEALFKDPPPKEDCPICFLPMPLKLICCFSLPPATVSSVPIHDYAEADEELAKMNLEEYFVCCGKSICRGCTHSFCKSGNIGKCPFCNVDRGSKTLEESVEEIRRRMAANDPASIYLLADCYYGGEGGVQQDHAKTMEQYARSAELGFSKAQNNLAGIYHEGGCLKKAKFHLEAAAMAGHEVARYNLGVVENNSGNIEQAIKHWTIAASAGSYRAMHDLITFFKKGLVSRDTIDSILTAYNKPVLR